MNLSTLVSLIRHLPEAERLVEAGEALIATPEAVEFDSALDAYQVAMGAKAAAPAPAAAPEVQAPYAGQHGGSIYTGPNATK